MDAAIPVPNRQEPGRSPVGPWPGLRDVGPDKCPPRTVAMPKRAAACAWSRPQDPCTEMAIIPVNPEIALDK